MNAHAPNPLRDLLHEEYRALTSYIDLTEREQEALVRGDVDAVEALARGKATMLERIGAARAASRHAMGNPATLSDLQERLCAAEPGVRDLFELVGAKAREASMLTKLSAKVLNRQIRRLQNRAEALGLTEGAVIAYGASGFNVLADRARRYA